MKLKTQESDAGQIGFIYIEDGDVNCVRNAYRLSTLVDVYCLEDETLTFHDNGIDNKYQLVRRGDKICSVVQIGSNGNVREFWPVIVE